MKKIKIFQILLIILALILTVYFVSSLMKPTDTTQNSLPAQNTNVPKSLTRFQDCVDRAEKSDAQQSIIDEAKRECERLYRP